MKVSRRISANLSGYPRTILISIQILRKFSDRKCLLHHGSWIRYCCGQECFHQEEITYIKQFELGVEEEPDKLLHLEHCSLWVKNMGSKKSR